jgi:uncharacterized protein (DUF58 family)
MPVTLNEILATVRRVEMRTTRLVNDMMVGAYLSFFKGRGMDFEELRDYIPGDDVRDIDWNVTYRLGRPFVKKFREERELGIILALDISASNEFSSTNRTKREYAAEVASSLAFSAARNSDKVGLLLFSSQIELFLPPRKGRKHILRLIREMLFFRPHHQGTHIPSALAFLNHVLHRRSFVFLLTDFLHSFESSAAKPNSGRDAVQEIGLTNARHDLVCVHIHDKVESILPRMGLVSLEDAETGEILEMDTHRASVRNQYADANRTRLEELDRALRLTGVDTIRLNTGQPFIPVLQRFFETRTRH